MQRPLWASTSTKNPSYPDTLYVDNADRARHGQHDAGRDHRGGPRPRDAGRSIEDELDEARALMRELEEIGVDVEDIVARQLVEEGVRVVRGQLRLADRDDRGQGSAAAGAPA